MVRMGAWGTDGDGMEVERSGEQGARTRSGGLRVWQAAVDDVIRRFPEGYWPPLANLARLTEEVGELARALNLAVGPKRRKASDEASDTAQEMGDVLFTLCVLANQLSVNLDDAMARTLAKVQARDLGDA
jgi:NTP pyrophosphatase (non-canonical NTP hydrolase)